MQWIIASHGVCGHDDNEPTLVGIEHCAAHAAVQMNAGDDQRVAVQWE